MLQHQELWNLVKTDRELCGVYIAACAGLVTLLAAMVEPYIPTIAAAIRYRRQSGWQACNAVHDQE